MTISHFNLFKTIRFKLMASLFTVLTISIGTAMFGIWTYERDQFIESVTLEALRGGRIIEKSLTTSMLGNDRQAIQQTITEISEIIEPPSRLTIISPNGTVAFSSDQSMIGSNFIRAQDPTCTICHLHEGTPPERSTILIDSATGPMLRNIIPISNQPSCHQCHSADTKTLGILLFDAYVESTFQMLRTVAFRILLTGFITFVALFLVMTWLVTKLIHRPIQDLITGFEEVGTGNFNYWVEIQGSDEFSEMADSFNVVSRAIGRYLDEIKVRSAETSTLYSMLLQLSKTIKLTELTGVVFDLLYEFFDYEEILLVRIEENRAHWFEATWRKKSEPRLHHTRFNLDVDRLPGTTMAVEELRRWASDGITLPIFTEDHDPRVLIPLIYNNEKTGIFSLRMPGGRPIPPQKKRLIGALASHVAISFANAKLYHMATTDGLTGLFTKRYFQETIAHMAAADPPFTKSFWLMMMDLDHFKEVNDTHGHPAGDQVLIQFADVIRANIRYGDIPCRYGGEEFIVVLPEVGENADFIESMADRLLKAVENNSFSCPDCPPIRLTVSIGLASFPEHASSVEGVIQEVDSALYDAKRGGRNQVRCAILQPTTKT
ncbi:MAG: diguanylate cyclase [Proteobacteria bacterium]|nr:diguanylate cyclase [Pseudomonadota bacterium]MBU1687142.1 diguanylate cyclase [Pseudomonadota bacterium]